MIDLRTLTAMDVARAERCNHSRTAFGMFCPKCAPDGSMVANHETKVMTSVGKRPPEAPPGGTRSERRAHHAKAVALAKYLAALERWVTRVAPTMPKSRFSTPVRAAKTFERETGRSPPIPWDEFEEHVTFNVGEPAPEAA